MSQKLSVYYLVCCGLKEYQWTNIVWLLAHGWPSAALCCMSSFFKAENSFMGFVSHSLVIVASVHIGE